MWRIEESISGSYAGRIAPPGMPKMCSVPAASSDLTKLCAPLIVAPACWLITVSCLVVGERKTPRPRSARGDAKVEAGSTRASGAYKEVRAHGPTVPAASRRRQASVSGVPSSGTSVSPLGPDRSVPADRAGDAGLVALGVGEHAERRRMLVGDQGAPRREGRRDPALRHVGRHGDVEVEPLARLRVGFGL